MDMQLLGETVAAEEGQILYGLWMKAGGNNGVAAVEVFYNSVANVFDVVLETKSSDQPDSAAVSIGTVHITTAGSAITTYQMLIENAKDLVRYRLNARGTCVVHLQYAQPLWQPN